MRRKKILVGLVLVSLVSLGYLVWAATRRPPSPVPAPSPHLLGTWPAPGRQTFTFPSLAVSFTFNQPVNIFPLTASVSPATTTSLSYNPEGTTVYVVPSSPWVFDTTYTVELIGLPSLVTLTFTPLHPAGSSEVFDEAPQY